MKNKNVLVVGLTVSMFAWGVSWPSGKVLASYGSSINIGFIRFILTFIGLLPILLIWQKTLAVKREGISTLILAAGCMALYSFLFFQGLRYGLPGAGGVLVTTLNPIIAYAIGLGLSKKMPNRREQIGLGLGLVAGCLLLKIWTNVEDIFSVGNSYFLLATTTWAILSKFTSKASLYGFPGSFSLWMYLLCSFALFLLADKTELVTIVTTSDWIFWLNIFFSAVITTSLATTFYFFATSQIGSERASSFIFLVPASAALTSWIVLEEMIHWNTIAGGCLGILAVIMINRK
jgi:drug/metabolite transporter (DMT)-like permease